MTFRPISGIACLMALAGMVGTESFSKLALAALAGFLLADTFGALDDDDGRAA